MTYHELFKYIKEKCINADVSNFTSDTSYQFNVRGEGEGAFYAEVKNNKLSVEPYEYYDRDVIFEADSKILIDIADRKLDPTEAILTGTLKFTGNHEKAMELSKLFKAEEKKTITKKDSEKKADANPAEKKTDSKKAEEKPVEKKPAAKKTAEKSVTKKSTAKKSKK